MNLSQIRFTFALDIIINKIHSITDLNLLYSFTLRKNTSY